MSKIYGRHSREILEKSKAHRGCLLKKKINRIQDSHMTQSHIVHLPASQSRRVYLYCKGMLIIGGLELNTIAMLSVFFPKEKVMFWAWDST